MCKFRCLVCLMLLCGLGFGSQPDECLFKKKQLAISLDWHKEISKPNSIEFSKYDFFNNRGISDFTLNDTTHMQGFQTDASRVTFGKIALESLGAVTCGYVITSTIWYSSFPRSVESSFYPINLLGLLVVNPAGCLDFPYAVGFSIGPAIGVTLIGNRLMKPRGSFLKSLIGAGCGAAIGMLINTPTFLVMYGGWEAGDEDPWKSWGWHHYGQIAALILPVAGAVVGYNHNISQKSVVPMMNSPEENKFLDGGSQRHCPSIRLQLITMRF